jgi:hypothetical protein
MVFGALRVPHTRHVESAQKLHIRRHGPCSISGAYHVLSATLSLLLVSRHNSA